MLLKSKKTLSEDGDEVQQQQPDGSPFVLGRDSFQWSKTYTDQRGNV